MQKDRRFKGIESAISEAASGPQYYIKMSKSGP